MSDIVMRLQCDRCKETIFLKYIGDGDTIKPSYGDVSSYESPPEGWEEKSINWKMYTFCPRCYAVLLKLFEKFMEELQ